MNKVQTQFGKDARRGYYRATNAWWKKSTNDGDPEVQFGIYHDEDGKGKGGTSGDMCIIWDDVGGRRVPLLKVYADGWKVLASFSDVITELEKVGKLKITEDQFCAILDRCGFIDLTKYNIE